MNNLDFLPTNFKRYIGDYSPIIQNIEEYLPLYKYPDRYAVENNLRAARWGMSRNEVVHAGMLSSAVGKRLVKILVSKIIGPGIFLNGNDQAKAGFFKVINESKLTRTLSKAFTGSVLRGSSLIKLDYVNKKVACNIVQLGRYQITKGFDEEIEKVRIFTSMFLGEDKMSGHVVVEERFYKTVTEGVQQVTYPYGIYRVSKCLWKEKQTIESYIKNDEVPDAITEWCESRNISINKEVRLPFSNIGVFQIDNTWTNTDFDSSLFGESSFLGLGDLFYSLDHSLTSKENDKYIGRGRVIVPKPLQAGIGNIQSVNKIINGIGTSMNPVSQGVRAPLDQTFYNEIPSTLDPTKAMQPESIQFDLRTNDWISTKGDEVCDICNRVGISPESFDPRLTPEGYKNIEQISAENDITRSTIEDKRKIATTPINEMLFTICDFLGISALSIEWSQVGLSNYSLLHRTVVEEYNAGLISQESALKRLHPEWTDEQVKNEMELIKSENKGIDSQDIFNRF